MADRPARAAVSSTSSRGWFTNTPTVETKGGNREVIARASSALSARGLRGQNTKPSALAPSLAARSASSARRRPQTFTLVSMRLSLSEPHGPQGGAGVRLRDQPLANQECVVSRSRQPVHVGAGPDTALRDGNCLIGQNRRDGVEHREV